MPLQETLSSDSLPVYDNDIVYFRSCFGRSRQTRPRNALGTHNHSACRTMRRFVGTYTFTETLTEEQQAFPQLERDHSQRKILVLGCQGRRNRSGERPSAEAPGRRR